VSAPDGRLGRRAALALALLAVLPFLNGLGADFTFDDKVIVRDNPRLSSPGRVGELFASHYFGGPLATAKNYRPVVLLTYAVQRWTTGTNPWPFHAVNVLLHAAVTLFLAAWLLALGMPRAPSLAAAALFAVAPIHVEAVTGIVGRAELLVALLVFAAALLFRNATDGTRVRAVPLAGALAAFLLALFAKENAVVLPGVVALGELLRADTGEGLASRLRRKALPFAVLLAPLAVFAAVRLLLAGGRLVGRREAFFELDNPLAPLPGALRAANGLWLLLRYAARTFVPVGLSADHSAHALDLVRSLADPRAAAGLTGVVLLAVAALFAVRRAPLASLGTGLALGAFLPTSNVLFPIGTIFGERLAYLPSAGLFAAATGFVAAASAISTDLRRALLGIALAGGSLATAARNEVFRDDDRLFADMLAKVPRSARAHYNVAWLAWGRREIVGAETGATAAVALFPRYYDAWSLLALARSKAGRHDAAGEAAREALAIRPDYEIGWTALASVEQAAGRTAEAGAAVTEGLRRFPASHALLGRRAAQLQAEGRLEEAAKAWEALIAIGGPAVGPRLGHARALSALGREADAIDEVRRALEARPDATEARLFLAGRLEASGRPLAAAIEASRAIDRAPRDPVPARFLLELAVRCPEARGRAASALAGIESSFGRPARNLALREAVAAFREAAGAPTRRRRRRPPRQSAKSGGISSARARRSRITRTSTR
jgi:tetratricopeptide (TPR) repeat protein